MSHELVYSTRAQDVFDSTPYLDDKLRFEIQDFYTSDATKLSRPLLNSSLLSLTLERNVEKGISVELNDESLSSYAALCFDVDGETPHYHWVVDSSQRAKKLGSLVRALKEIPDGTLRYEQAKKKVLAIPLIAWGYMPVALSLNGFENDVSHPSSEDEMLVHFSKEDDWLPKPVWLEYNPLNAKQFLTKLNYQKEKR